MSGELEAVYLSFCILDRGFGIGPCEADFECSKRNAVDNDRLPIGAPNPGVPQPSPSLEGFDYEAVIIQLHFLTPAIRSREPRVREKECELVHIGAFFGRKRRPLNRRGAWICSRVCRAPAAPPWRRGQSS